jgi:cytochrome P450
LDHPPSLELPSAALLADPHALWRRLRAEAPISRVLVGGGGAAGGEEAWAVAGYLDCLAVMSDRRLALPPLAGWVPPGLGEGPAARVLPRLLALQDPREPNPMRARVSRVFAPRAVDAMRLRVREVVEETLDRAEDKGTFDLVTDFAFPVSVLAVAELLGVPSEDCGLLRTWAPHAARMLEPARLDAEAIEACHAATESLWVYFEEHVRRRRRTPDDDLLSRLVERCDAEGVCGDAELVAFCVQLLAIGFRATESLIAGGARALVLHPGAARKLARDAALAVPAVEECARWDSPVQMTSRLALEDLLLGGFPIGAGEKVYVLIASANRDAEIFEHPDAFDVRRRGAPHLTFGCGTRPLLGSHMARMQAQVALRQLARRFPELEPRGGEVYRPSLLMRSLRHFPVAPAA